MPLDTSIYGLIRPPQQQPGPLDQYTQALTLRGMMDDQGLKQLQRGQLEKSIANDARIAGLFANGTPTERDIMAIDPTKGIAYGKAMQERETAKSTLEKNKAETLAKNVGILRDNLATVNDQNGYDQWRELNARLLGPDVAAKIAPQFDPAKKESALMTADKLLERLKPIYSVQDFGGTKGVVQGNPLATGGVTGIQAKTQTPESVASVGATIRGQNLTDARARETLAAGKWTNDLERGLQVNTQTGETRPITQGGAPIGMKDKDLTDSQAKSLLFANRMKEADQILTELAAGGKFFSTPGARTGFGVGAAMNVVNTEAGQKLDQAKRNFINAVLRRESGAVISPSEFENAEQQYFPQVGDAAGVIEQKAANRKTAQEGIMVEVPPRKRPKETTKPQVDKSVPDSAPTRAEIDAELRRRGIASR